MENMSFWVTMAVVSTANTLFCSWRHNRWRSRLVRFTLLRLINENEPINSNKPNQMCGYRLRGLVNAELRFNTVTGISVGELYATLDRMVQDEGVLRISGGEMRGTRSVNLHSLTRKGHEEIDAYNAEVDEAME